MDGLARRSTPGFLLFGLSLGRTFHREWDGSAVLNTTIFDN
jgi:hypothetical protein